MTADRIQMKRNVLTKTFIMISNWKNLFGLHGLYKQMLTLRGLTYVRSIKRQPKTRQSGHKSSVASLKYTTCMYTVF